MTKMKDDEVVPGWREPGPEMRLKTFGHDELRPTTWGDIRKVVESAGVRLISEESRIGDMVLTAVEQAKRIAELEREVERLRFKNDEARSIALEMRQALQSVGIIGDDGSQSTLDVVKRLTSELAEARKGSQPVEPGQPIGNTTCPCCGAELEVMHGEEPGMIATLGTRKGQPGAVVVANETRDVEVLRMVQERGGPERGRNMTAGEWEAYRRASIIERRHIEVLREVVRHVPRSCLAASDEAWKEAMKATE